MTDTTASSENAAIVGREDLHDIEAILSVVGSDEGELIRAVQDNAFVQRAYARWTDVLGGFARRALDPKYEEPEAREARSQDEARSTHGRRREIIRIIRPGEEPPEDLGPRVPRPWQ